MRWLLVLMLGFMATTAAAQQGGLELVHRYAQVPTASVDRWRIKPTGQESCQVVVDGPGLLVQFIWEPGHPAPSMVLSRRDWKFPGSGIQTPVEVLFDGKRVRDGGGADEAVMMTASGDTLTYRWQGDLAPFMDGVQRIGFVFKEGVAFDASVRLPAVRLLLMGLKDCRADLPAPP